MSKRGGSSPARSPKKLATFSTAASIAANAMQAAKTADKLEPLVNKGLLQPGQAAFTVKCKGATLPTTASLTDTMQIVLDDDDMTRIQSINELKNIVFAKHGVQSSTNPWKVIFHGGYSRSFNFTL
eukprot:182761-Prymnesium_polylepis.1